MRKNVRKNAVHCFDFSPLPPILGKLMIAGLKRIAVGSLPLGIPSGVCLTHHPRSTSAAGRRDGRFSPL